MWWQALIAPITGVISTVLERKREKSKAKHERAMAVINNQARLAQSTLEFNHSWEMASLQDKDKVLRNVSFFLFTFPLVITSISPETGKVLFANLELVPEWLMHIYFYMIAGVWGISALKDNVSQIVSSLRGNRSEAPTGKK